MEQKYSPPSQPEQAQRSDTSNQSDGSENQDQHNSASSSGSMSQVAGKFAENAGDVAKGAPGKILSTGGLIMAILLSLLLGLAYVVRSLKNVKLTLRLLLKRDDRAEKKY